MGEQETREGLPGSELERGPGLGEGVDGDAAPETVKTRERQPALGRGPRESGRSPHWSEGPARSIR